MIKNLKKSSTYYAPVNCEACGAVTDYGEAIAVRVDIVSPSTFTISKTWATVCPNCYKRATKAIKTDRVKVPTCLSDPERRAELLERYKEE